MSYLYSIVFYFLIASHYCDPGVVLRDALNSSLRELLLARTNFVRTGVPSSSEEDEDEDTEDKLSSSFFSESVDTALKSNFFAVVPLDRGDFPFTEPLLAEEGAEPEAAAPVEGE